MDQDMENFTFNPMYIDQVGPLYHTSFFIHLLWIIVSLAALSMDIYLIVVIKKFKTLESSRSYKYFLAFAISHLCYMLLSQILSMFFEVISHGLSQTRSLLVTIIDCFCLEMGLYVLTFMAIDWYFFHYYRLFYDKHLKVFNHGVLVSFLILFFKSFVVLLSCFVNDHILGQADNFIFLDFFDLASFFLCFITLTLLFITWKRKTPNSTSKKYEYSLIVPWVYFLMSLPLNIFYVVNVFQRPEYYSVNHEVLLDCLAIVSYLGVIVVVLLLGKYDKHFKMADLECCKGKYKNENFQDAVSDVGSEDTTVTFDGQVVNL
ncbi:uncharacterized protein LOC115886693 isoform X2 [Sitophilus oryzae]|uniref:Uncharacterized protein LOC115886693 isoform X2 n=1 Tax=Sitophilus oryzae TaxID=7048 RepID=A0A6J2YEP9_SITOR|nr:uncharacterized protein LOC115886693 isoform X2 [Sitophilus oryzae]XP_030761815.1 uncharacterized protein LOC115886693 isoform X2 [Sitophilus oryzae]XP_030761816.1 uncharacterized protein LOC115886693 isoform X2 [Sitophilus oryzae]